MPRPLNEMDFDSVMGEDSTLDWAQLNVYVAAIGKDECKASVSKHQPTADTLKERGARYGRFANNSKVTQHLKDVVKFSILEQRDPRYTPDALGGPGKLSPFQREAIDMILHKLGRIICGDPDYVDSWHDIAGYALLVEKILNGENP